MALSSAGVAAPYIQLYTYLDHRYASTVVLTFEQIETLLGCALPPSASTDRDWWTVASNAHASAWTSANRSAVPNLQARSVTFQRQE